MHKSAGALALMSLMALAMALASGDDTAVSGPEKSSKRPPEDSDEDGGGSGVKSCVELFPNVCIAPKFYTLIIVFCSIVGTAASLYFITVTVAFVILRRMVRLPFHCYYILFNWSNESTRGFLDE